MSWFVGTSRRPRLPSRPFMRLWKPPGASFPLMLRAVPHPQGAEQAPAPGPQAEGGLGTLGAENAAQPGPPPAPDRRGRTADRLRAAGADARATPGPVLPPQGDIALRPVCRR